jgi:hypothetical protein
MAKKVENLKPRAKRRPKPDTLKLEGNWIDNVNNSMAVKKPGGGWPDQKGRNR